MRKVLSFVLVLSLVLGSFAMAFASYSDMADESSAEAVDVLSGLGVISGYPDGTFRPDNIVTRAEMATLIVAALGLEEYATSTTSRYPDMSAASWAQGYVAYGTSLGFISGYPDGTFRPNQTVSYEEACSMILRALGYTSEFLPGEWPAEWVVKAKALGILDGISAATSTGANRGDIAEMLYNSLDLRIGYVDKDGVWQEYKDTKNGTDIFDTMLGRLGATFVAADDLVDGLIYGGEKTVINLRPFVGAYADRYLDKDDKIIKVVPISEFVEGEFTSATVFEAIDGTEYKLGKDVSEEAPSFVNGAYTEDEIEIANDLNKNFTLAVEIDGKYFSEIYSVTEWVVSDAFQVEKEDLEELADDDTLHGNDFAQTSKDEIDMNSFELIGIDSLDDLEEDYVVYVYKEPKDSDSPGVQTGDIRRVAVGTETAEGKVTRLASSGNKVTIDGKAYDLADELIEGVVKAGDVKLGATGTAYLDYAGNIYAWEEEDGSVGNYAIVIAVDSTADTDFDSNRVRLLLADGTKKNFNVDDKVSLAGLAKGDLVTYSVNKDGEINKIEEKDVEPETGKLSKSGSNFANMRVDTGVVVFVMDGAEPDDVVKLADVSRDEITLDYFAPAGGRIEVLIIDEDAVDAGRDTVFAVINRVEDAIDADEDEVHYVYGFANGEKFEAYTDSTAYFDGYDATDKLVVFELKVDADGVIVKVEGEYDLADILDGDMSADDAVVINDTVDSRSGYSVQIDGKWYDIDSDAVFYEYDDEKTSNPFANKRVNDVKKDVEVVLVQVDKDSEGYDFVLLLKNF